MFGSQLLIKISEINNGCGAQVARMKLAIVTEDAVQGLQAEIPAPALALQLIEKADRLDIVLKGRQAMFFTECGQEMFAIVTKGGVADIMTQGNGLNEILIEMEEAADGPGNSGDQLHMQDPMGDVVIGDQAEDLGLVYVAGVCPGVEDTVGIQRIGLSVTSFRLFLSSSGLNAQAGSRRKAPLFIDIELVLDGKKKCLWV
jgi:hypothetical protein